jgi:hypothetical protein
MSVSARPRQGQHERKIFPANWDRDFRRRHANPFAASYVFRATAQNTARTANGQENSPSFSARDRVSPTFSRDQRRVVRGPNELRRGAE